MEYDDELVYTKFGNFERYTFQTMLEEIATDIGFADQISDVTDYFLNVENILREYYRQNDTIQPLKFYFPDSEEFINFLEFLKIKFNREENEKLNENNKGNIITVAIILKIVIAYFYYY